MSEGVITNCHLLLVVMPLALVVLRMGIEMVGRQMVVFVSNRGSPKTSLITGGLMCIVMILVGGRQWCLVHICGF